MRLIDADELKKWVEGHYEHSKYYHPYTKREKYRIPIDEVMDMIDEMPTFEAISTTEWLKMCIARQEQIKTLLNNWEKDYETD